MSPPSLTAAAPNVTEKLLDPLRLPMILEEWAAPSTEGRQQADRNPDCVLRPIRTITSKMIPVRSQRLGIRWELDNAMPLNTLSPWRSQGLASPNRVENTIEDVDKGLAR